MSCSIKKNIKNNTVMLTGKNIRVILIGRAARYFDSSVSPKRNTQDLKFIMLRDNDGIADVPLTMLIMETSQPFDYHPEAVLQYMKEWDVWNVITNGAGKIAFRPGLRRCSFSSASKSFGMACVHEVFSFISAAWPTFDIEYQGTHPPVREIAYSGIPRSYTEIKEMVEAIQREA